MLYSIYRSSFVLNAFNGTFERTLYLVAPLVQKNFFWLAETR